MIRKPVRFIVKKGSDKSSYFHLFELIAHAEQGGGCISHDELAFLQLRDRLLYFVKFAAGYPKNIFDDLVIDRLLLHNERVLGIEFQIN